MPVALPVCWYLVPWAVGWHLSDSALLLCLCWNFLPASILPCYRPKPLYLSTNENSTQSLHTERHPTAFRHNWLKYRLFYHMIHRNGIGAEEPPFSWNLEEILKDECKNKLSQMLKNWRQWKCLGKYLLQAITSPSQCSLGWGTTDFLGNTFEEYLDTS